MDVAATATDGHWLATENPYDAIVLDAMLPGMSGEESGASCARPVSGRRS